MIYQPAEDSLFLSEVIKKYLSKFKEDKKEIKVLDLGTGSGIQSKTLISLGVKKENITASDINHKALKEAEKLGVKTIKSNLFENLNETYSLIIFNPPYLPEDNYDGEIDTTGGKKGDELIIKFIKTLNKHLNKKGVCFLLTSSFTPNKEWQKIAKTLNFKVKKIASKNLFFEELYVWKISQ